jgi:hypothetical protein
MRIRHETFRIPAKKERPPSGNHNEKDHTKVKQSILQIKQQIEDVEKKFKNFLVLKRRQDANQGLKGMLEEPLNIDELIQKAKLELQTFKTQQQNITDDKSRVDQVTEENLARRIQETKEWFRKRKSLIQSGPQFLRHTFSPFGNILLVSALTENIFAVFSSRNTVELWEKSGDDFEVKEAYEIPGSTVLTILELYHQETVNEADYLSEVIDPEDFLVGMREEGRRNGEKLPPLQGVDVPSTLQQNPSKERKVLRVEDLNRIASMRAGGQKNIDWSNYPFSDAPIVSIRHCFFCGYESGEGSILELISSYNPISQTTTYRCQVRVKKRLSYTPLRLAFFYYLPEGIPIIVAEITVKNGDGMVQGYRINLDKEWACKSDMIRLTVTDRCTRYVNREQLFDLEYDENPRLPEEPIITSYAYDEVHFCILMGTSQGVIVRFFYQRQKIHDVDSRAVTPSGYEAQTPSVTSQQEAALPGKLMWCLEGNPVSQLIKLNEKEEESGLSVQPPPTNAKSSSQLSGNKVKMTY